MLFEYAAQTQTIPYAQTSATTDAHSRQPPASLPLTRDQTTPAEVTETGATTEGGGPRGPSSQGHNLSLVPSLVRSGPLPQKQDSILLPDSLESIGGSVNRGTFPIGSKSM